MLFAADLVTLLQNDLNDHVRTSEAVMLRQLSRAQHWVALRHRALRHTYGISLIPNAPFVDLFPLIPRLVVVTSCADETGTMLDDLSHAHISLYDSQWISRSGTPEGYYRIGWRHIGFYPVPNVAVRYTLTALILPVPFVTMQDPMTLPDTFAPRVATIAAGLLTMSQFRRYTEGKAMILRGLGAETPAVPGGGTRAA